MARVKLLACTLIVVVLLLALSGCGSSGSAPAAPADPAAPNAPAASPVENAAQPNAEASPTQPAEVVKGVENSAPGTRGPGDFELSDPASGLDGLTRYRAALTLDFEGQRGGAPYQLHKRYEQVVDASQQAQQLKMESSGDEGQPAQTFSAQVGQLRFVQSAPEQPCQASLVSPEAAPVFQPVRLLPKLAGAEPGGEETVNGVAAKVYSFDALALNAGADAKAAGKLWVAVSGGWVVKYELTLESETLFGEGISGKQRWAYEVSEVDSAVVQLPESCPQAMVDLPLPDGAQVTQKLPGLLRFTASQDPASAGAFFVDSLTAQGWVAQGKPVESQSGTRWLFSRPEGDKEWVTLVTARPAEGGADVTIFQVKTDAPQTTQ